LLGDTRELRKVFFERITIKPANDENWYKEICNSIVTNKSKGISTFDFEKSIDAKIFDLYELTEIERSLILSVIDPEDFSRNAIKSISFAENE